MVSMPGTRSTVGRSGPLAYLRCTHTRPPETREDGGEEGESTGFLPSPVNFFSSGASV